MKNIILQIKNRKYIKIRASKKFGIKRNSNFDTVVVLGYKI